MKWSTTDGDMRTAQVLHERHAKPVPGFFARIGAALDAFFAMFLK